MVHNFMVAEPNHPQSKPFQKSRPFRIICPPVGCGVAVAIDLNCQLQFGTIEIDKIRTKRTLATETVR